MYAIEVFDIFALINANVSYANAAEFVDRFCKILEGVHHRHCHSHIDKNRKMQNVNEYCNQKIGKTYR